jgi:hypothetical protein
VGKHLGKCPFGRPKKDGRITVGVKEIRYEGKDGWKCLSFMPTAELSY